MLLVVFIPGWRRMRLYAEQFPSSSLVDATLYRIYLTKNFLRSFGILPSEPWSYTLRAYNRDAYNERNHNIYLVGVPHGFIVGEMVFCLCCSQLLLFLNAHNKPPSYSIPQNGYAGVETRQTHNILVDSCTNAAHHCISASKMHLLNLSLNHHRPTSLPHHTMTIYIYIYMEELHLAQH